VRELVDNVTKAEPDTFTWEFIGVIAGPATVYRSNKIMYLVCFKKMHY